MIDSLIANKSSISSTVHSKSTITSAKRPISALNDAEESNSEDEDETKSKKVKTVQVSDSTGGTKIVANMASSGAIVDTNFKDTGVSSLFLYSFQFSPLFHFYFQLCIILFVNV